MEKIIGNWSTRVKMTSDEAKDICRFGQREKGCAFLVFDKDSFECIRMSHPKNLTIFAGLRNDTLLAKGEGGWAGCAWEKEQCDD